MSIYTLCTRGKADPGSELLQGRNGPRFKLQPKLSSRSKVEMLFDDGICLGTCTHRCLVLFWGKVTLFILPKRSTKKHFVLGAGDSHRSTADQS